MLPRCGGWTALTLLDLPGGGQCSHKGRITETMDFPTERANRLKRHDHDHRVAFFTGISDAFAALVDAFLVRIGRLAFPYNMGLQGPPAGKFLSQINAGRRSKSGGFSVWVGGFAAGCCSSILI